MHKLGKASKPEVRTQSRSLDAIYLDKTHSFPPSQLPSSSRMPLEVQRRQKIRQMRERYKSKTVWHYLLLSQRFDRTDACSSIPLTRNADVEG